jgi:hypothetical protein
MSAFSSTFSEPFTPRGVAAFARAGLNRLLLSQLVFALLGAASIVWFLDDNCFPAVDSAIQNLPATGEIRSGQLRWRGESPKMLAEGKFLMLNVDLEHSGGIHSAADLQIEFGKSSIRFISLLGYSEIYYPPRQAFSFNRREIEPLWNAWREIILFGAALVTAIFLPLSWWMLATVYCVPVWIFGFYTNRDLTLRACWKLSAASLLPGALLMIAGIFAYNSGLLDMISFGFVAAAHFVLGWIYLIVALIFIPRISTATPKGNPFESRN